MIRIIADSTCDISKAVAKEHGIKIISTKVIIDGNTINDFDYDGPSLDEFYTTLDSIKNAPDYEPPNYEEYVKAIEDGLFHGVKDFIILIPSSQQIDDFTGVVNKAIESFEKNNRVPEVRVRMINTLNVSQGFGYSVLKAAKMAKKGASFEQIIDYIEENKSKVKDFFAVPDVDFLYKTGNVTKGAAKATKIFGITPVMKLGVSGKATLASKVVGGNKIAECFSNEFKHNADIRNTDFVIIGYSTDIEPALKTKSLILQQTNFEGEIFVMQMRPAFGAHMGKGAVGIYFLGKKSSVALFNLFRFS